MKTIRLIGVALLAALCGTLGGLLGTSGVLAQFYEFHAADVRIGGTDAPDSGIEVDVRTSEPAGSLVLRVMNSSDTASSRSQVQSTVAGASSGDPMFRSVITGETGYSWGQDNDDSDEWKLSRGSALGTNDVIVAHSADELSFPGMPTASVTGSGSHTVNGSNVTWDGPENWDVGAMHDNITNSSRLTVPVAGKYLLGATIGFTCITALDGKVSFRFNLNGGSGPIVWEGDPTEKGSSTGIFKASASLPWDLSASDYLEVSATEDGSTMTCNVTRGFSTFWIQKLS